MSNLEPVFVSMLDDGRIYLHTRAWYHKFTPLKRALLSTIKDGVFSMPATFNVPDELHTKGIDVLPREEWKATITLDRRNDGFIGNFLELIKAIKDLGFSVQID